MAKKRKKVSDKLERPCWVNYADAGLLLDLLVAARPRHPLLGRLRQIMEQLEDEAEQARDLVKREKSNGFFDNELSNIKPLVGELKKHRKASLGEYAKEVAHPSAKAVVAKDGRLRKLRGGVGE